MARERICAKCGVADEVPDKHHPDDEPCDHDWSDPDPLSRLEARIESSSFGAEVINSETNEKWHWLEVRLTGFDLIGASEAVTNEAHAEDFDFIGLGEGGEAVRFNKERDGS